MEAIDCLENSQPVCRKRETARNAASLVKQPGDESPTVLSSEPHEKQSRNERSANRLPGDDFISRDELSKAFGIAGWLFFLIWRCYLLLIPSSPFYYYLGSNWTATIFSLAIVLAPYAITAFLPHLFSTRKNMTFLAFVCGACITVEPFTQIPLMSIALLSIALWGMHVLWRPYVISHMESYRQQGIRAFVEAACVLGIACIGNLYGTKPFIAVLPIISLAIFIPCHYFASRNKLPRDCTVKFAQKKDLANQTLSKTLEQTITGACVGCIFSSGVTEIDALLLLSANFVASGLVLYAGEKILMQKMTLQLAVIILFITAPPIMLSIPFIHGYPLAIVGAIGMFIGRTRTVIGIKIGFDGDDTFSSSSKISEVSWERFFDTFGLFLGIAASCLAFSTGSLLVIFVLFAGLLWITIVAIALYYAYIVSDYEDFIQNEKTNPVLPRMIDDDAWSKKIAAAAIRYGLTPRQKEVLLYLAKGRNAERIASEMFLSHATIKSHIYAIYKKMHVHTQQELIDLLEKTTVK